MTIKASSQITIVDITDSYSVLLSSEAYTFVGNATGAQAGLSCTTQVIAYQGSQQCSNVTISSIKCPNGISATISDNGTSSPTITFTTTDVITEACEAIISISIDDEDFKIVSIENDDGSQNIYMYENNSSNIVSIVNADGSQSIHVYEDETSDSQKTIISKKFSFSIAKQGVDGEDGKGIKSSEISYQVSSSGVDIPTGEWIPNIPETSVDTPYLWTRTIITYTDDTTSESYSVGSTPEGYQEADENIRQTILDQNTSIISDCESIIMSALESYVLTSNYDEFKQTVSSQLELLSDELTLSFNTTTQRINEIDGNLQNEITERSKLFSFSEENGLIISAGDNAMSIRIDNDIVSFEKNGERFGWWDGIDFHTGNIIIDVTERAQFGNFAYVPNSDGSLSFLKVGGE